MRTKIRALRATFLWTAMASILSLHSICRAQSDAVFVQTGTNSWETRNDFLPDPNSDDGNIVLQSGYSRSFGAGSTVRIKHQIHMNGSSGLSGADGGYMEGMNPNGQAGGNGQNGFPFNISADTIIVQPFVSTNPGTGGAQIVSPGVTSNGGSGGSGGTSGGWVIYEDPPAPCGDVQVERGDPGEGGTAGNGGSITLNGKVVYLYSMCDDLHPPAFNWVIPTFTANGGSGGSAGNAGTAEPPFTSYYLGGGLSGAAGGSGGTVSFGKAQVIVDLQPAENFNGGCDPLPGDPQSAFGGECMEVEQFSSLSRLTLGVNVGGGGGGNGGSPGVTIDYFNTCEPIPGCAGTGQSGGSGGSGGDGGSLVICSPLPVLFSAGGGNGGNGSAGGSDSDPVTYLYGTNGGDGGAGGDGGTPGLGCGVYSTAPAGLGGLGGPGASATCENGTNGTAGADGAPRPQPPPPTPGTTGCGFTFSVTAGSQTYRIGDPYTGSIAEGRGLEPHEGSLRLFLQKNGANVREIRIDSISGGGCLDQLNFSINRSPAGADIGFPTPDVYDVYITNGICDAVHVQGLTVLPGPAQGSSCSNPLPALCESLFDGGNQIPGMNTVDLVPCIQSAQRGARWLQVELAARTAVTVEIRDEDFYDEVGVGIYESCAAVPANPAASACAGDGIASVSYRNDREQSQVVYVLLNHHEISNHPTVIVQCTKLPIMNGGWGHITAMDFPTGESRIWGQNVQGQLGDGTNVDKITVALRPPGLIGTQLRNLQGRGKTTLAIMPDKSIRSWGWNRWGNLGNGQGGNGTSDAFDQWTPVTVLTSVGGPAFGPAKTIHLGAYMSAAVKEDVNSTLWTWGNNNWGQLGNNTQTMSYLPVQVINANLTPFTGVSEVQVGHSYMVGLKTNGEVWAWGRNYSHECGQGTGAPTIFKTPVQVKKSPDNSPLTNIKHIYGSGGWSAFALDQTGVLWSWGDNYYGQLGNGSTTPKPTASPVLNADQTPVSDVLDVFVAPYHVLLVRKDGSVWSWGNDQWGQLGNDNLINTPSYYPTRVKTVTDENLVDCVAVYSGDWYCFALKRDGTMMSWGPNWHGELATNNQVTRYRAGVATAFPPQ